MTLVIDANVAAKWFVNQVHSDAARRVQLATQALVAPSLLIAEVLSALWQHVNAGDIDADQARQASAALPRCFSHLVPDETLRADALELAMNLQHSTYDCFYLALAKMENSVLISADTKFIRKLAKTEYKALIVPLTKWVP